MLGWFRSPAMIDNSKLPEIIAARYVPIRLIATGGMGAVYEVEHARTGDRLALKLLLDRVGSAPEMVERFKREARASARIKSENVVRVTDADVAPELGGAPFLVMELLEGTDLERLAEKARPAAADVVEWLRQAARAVDKAHGLGIVHRDLKPGNLFLSRSEGRLPVVKVLDFGIAKMIEDGTGATGSGQILGTPGYMAPEQASSRTRVTPAADRYALGLIAYRLLTGENYHRGDMMSILGDLVHGKLETPSARGHALGAAFDAWFVKACHRDPDERFASAAEQMDALAEALGLPVQVGAPTGGTSTRAGASEASARVRRIVLAAGALTVATIAVALALWRAGARTPDAPPVAEPPQAAVPTAPQPPREIAPVHAGTEAADPVAASPQKPEPKGRAAAARRPGAGTPKMRPADPFADQK